jgi:hypothetical protein
MSMKRQKASVVRDIVGRVGNELRRDVSRLVTVRLGWLFFALLPCCLVLDALFGFHGLVRLVVDAALVGALLTVARLTKRRFLGTRSRDRMIARGLETADPALGNTVVNAVDFEERLDEEGEEALSRALMGCEIDRARTGVGDLVSRHPLKPVELRKEPRLLAAVLGGCLLFALVQPRVFWTTLPRFLLPGADFPPYCPTRLTVVPGNAEADYGDAVQIMVTTTGKAPASVSLVFKSRRDGGVTELPAYETKANQYVQTLDLVTDDLVYYARVPGGRSKRYRLTVRTVPRIDGAFVGYEYPAYTHLRPERHALTDGQIKGYAGTKVTLTVVSNRRLSGGRLTVGKAEVDLVPETDAHRASGTFVLTEDAGFDAFVRDAEGVASKQRVTGKVRVMPDEKPDLAVVSPGKDSFVTPSAEVPINIEARDDIGVARIHLFRNHNESRDYRKDLYEAPGTYPFVNVIETLNMADLGVRPGDIIDYFAAATDSNPRSPGSAASGSFRLLVISEEEYAELVRAQMTAAQLREKYEQLLASLNELIEEQEEILRQSEQLRSAAEAEGENAELNEAGRRLEAAQRKVMERLAELGRTYEREADLPGQYDVEKDFKQALATLAGRMQGAGESLAKSRAALGGACQTPSAEAIRQAMDAAIASQKEALEALGRTQDEFRDGIAEAGRDIEELFELRRDVETFKYLLERQKAVERQSRYFADKKTLDFDDRVRMKELAQEQAAIRQALQELREALLRHADPVRDRYPRVADDAKAIAAAIEGLQIADMMNAAATAFAEDKGLDGHGHALAAYEAMLSMVSICRGASGNAQSDCEARLRIVMGMELGATFQQLSQSLNSGLGGGVGGVGVGSAGLGGSVQTPFGLYGGSDLMNSMADKSQGIGRGKSWSTLPDGTPREVASDSEDMSLAEKSDVQIELPGGERIIEEYRPAIIEYFTRLAEENQ